MAGNALIVWGGWDGHEPQAVARILERALKAEGFAVEVSDTLDAFKDRDKLMRLSLIVPHWTMGKITDEQIIPILEAVNRAWASRAVTAACAIPFATTPTGNS